MADLAELKAELSRADDHILESANRFLGIGLQHHYAALKAFELIFRGFSPFARVVELGVGAGALSLYLGLLCHQRGAKFYSYDTLIPKGADTKVWRWLQGTGTLSYGRGDIFSKDLSAQICSLVADSGRTLLYCDDGDKEKEARKFAPRLKRGDILGCHDWDYEYSGERLTASLGAMGFEPLVVTPYLQGFFFKTGS